MKKMQLTAREVWLRDEAKTLTALKRGFQVMTIWESEYIEDDQSINRIVKWLNSK